MINHDILSKTTKKRKGKIPLDGLTYVDMLVIICS